ncbi:MAG TPA: SPOR domain-containing protein, partial [Acidobacteriaceae bacterium]
KWCVQVGAFSNPGNAVKLKDDLSRRYTTAQVIEFTGPTGHWVRVKTPQGDKTRATQIAEAIRPKEPTAEAYLVRLD